MVSLLALGATVLPAGSPAVADTTAPLKVMITGDSISAEFAGDYTWRYRLHQEFARQGVPVNFVGPRTGVTGNPPLPLLPWADDQHDALGGTRLKLQLPYIRRDVAKYQPSVLLVMLGFNDLNHGAHSGDVIDNMRTYLTRVWEAKPDAVVVLSHVLDNVIYPGTEPRKIPLAQVNAGYDGLVKQFSDAGHRIVIADETARWVPRSHTVDGVHPTPTGEMVMAQHYGATLHALGYLPAPSRVPQGYMPWITPARPTIAHLSRHRIRFGYSAYQARLTMYGGILRITGSRLSRPIIADGRAFASSYTRTMPRGRYTVQLAPTRKWLVGRYGPPVTFTVK